MIPDNVETIIMTKEDYDRNVEKILLENIELKQEIERLNDYIKFYEDLSSKQNKTIERLNNIIGTIKGMFKDNDNHFEDGCDCEKIENFLEILDKENKDIELDMLKALNTDLDDDVEMG